MRAKVISSLMNIGLQLPKKDIANVILGQKVYTLLNALALKNDLKIML